MALTLAKNSRARCSHVWKLLLLALPLFGILLMGCNNTCFIFTSNPPAGTINIKAGDPKPTCMLTTANGAVRVAAFAAVVAGAVLLAARNKETESRQHGKELTRFKPIAS